MGDPIESGKSNDKLILMYVPYAIERIRLFRNVSVEELRYVRKTSPEFFNFIRNQNCEEHIEFLASYLKDPYFGVYIEQMLSPKGLKWLRLNFPIMKQVAEEEK